MTMLCSFFSCFLVCTTSASGTEVLISNQVTSAPVEFFLRKTKHILLKILLLSTLRIFSQTVDNFLLEFAKYMRVEVCVSPESSLLAERPRTCRRFRIPNSELLDTVTCFTGR